MGCRTEASTACVTRSARSCFNVEPMSSRCARVAGHGDLRTTAQYLHGNIEQARQAMARLAEVDRGSNVVPSLVLN